MVVGCVGSGDDVPLASQCMRNRRHDAIMFYRFLRVLPLIRPHVLYVLFTGSSIGHTVSVFVGRGFGCCSW